MDECDYCKTLLETLNPTSFEAAEFASKAKRIHAGARHEWIAAAAQGWVGDVKIGSGADATTAVAAATADPTFPAGQPVHLVTKVQNAPNHTPISVIWVGPDNQEVRKEINWTRAGEKMLAFTVADTAAWKSGEYRAELWVADRKVQQAQFGITPMEQTEQDP